MGAAALVIGLTVVTAVGGTLALGVVLPLAYALQVAPAVWCAYRTSSPSGIAAARWVLIAVESMLWGLYGTERDDPALTLLGTLGLAAASLILLRKLASRRRGRASIPNVGVGLATSGAT